VNGKTDNPTGEYLSTLTLKRPVYTNGRFRTPVNRWRIIHMTLVVLTLIGIFSIGLNL